jgi:small-conductance mechanosensitive channel
MDIPANWPELTLALVLALLAAYLLADLIARLVTLVLRAIIADPTIEAAFVERPRVVIRGSLFALIALALAFPALKMAGYTGDIGTDPEALARWLLGRGARITLIFVVGYFVIKIGAAATRRLEREMSRGSGLDVIERTKRGQTLSRLMRKALTVVVVSLAVLMIMRELEVDITPVLTGAGIAGLAVGFGAQTLVRDVISGFFLILEDQVRVGDVAVVNGQGGLVEEVNLRTIVLRDEEGAVHVFPNGEVKTLANKSKDFSFYIITVSVPTEEDPDRVMDALRDAGASMTTDPEYQPHILEPIEIYGIDAWEAGQITIKARIKTVPLKQWFVGRELRRRITRIFGERRIAVPIPKMDVVMHEAHSSSKSATERTAEPTKR